jgi:micrococcal nuclease
MVRRTRRVLLTLFAVVGVMAAAGRFVWDSGVFDAPPQPAPVEALAGSGAAAGDLPVRRVSTTGEAASGQTARVVRVYDGDTILVSIDGVEERVRLIGVDTPEAPWDERPGQPGHEAATDFVKQLIGTRPVRLLTDARSRNRDTYDRLLRHVLVRDGRYLSDALIENGLGFAVVRYRHSRIDRVIELEQEALNEGRGLWSDASVEDVSWKAAPKHVGRVVRVEGKIVATHNTGRICFLNFHRNYREHLTAVIYEPSFDLFPKPPERFYEGKTVRVIGRVTEYKGRPQIRVHAPDQIPVIPPGS